MKKEYILLLVISILVLTSCNSEVVIYDDFSIIGDVNNSINLMSVTKDLETIEYEYNDVVTKAYEIRSLINLADPISKDFSVVIVANDMFSTKLDGNTLENTHLVYDEDEKWVFVSNNHPKNSKVKNIKEIIIVNNNLDYDYGINLIDENNTINYSLGNLLANGYELMPIIDGNTAKTVDGKKYAIDVMKYIRAISLDNLYENKARTILLTSKKGEYQYLYNQNIYLELENDSIHLYDKSSNNIYEDVNGLMLDPPDMSNLEIYNMVSDYLKSKEQVLVILIDGFSFSQYQNIVENNKEYYLSNTNTTYKSTSVYKPVTNAGFSTILTGQKPINHGVLDRSFREVKTDTMFDFAKKLNLTSVLIEGDINILNLDVDTKLNLDSNSDGFNEDEIYQSALKNLDNDLVFVHFHSVDNAGHSYGPFGEETIDRIKVVDSYVEGLASQWDGKILIVSDHGMHETDSGGSHGQFRSEDIFVPILVMDGEK